MAPTEGLAQKGIRYPVGQLKLHPLIQLPLSNPTCLRVSIIFNRCRKSPCSSIAVPVTALHNRKRRFVEKRSKLTVFDFEDLQNRGQLHLLSYAETSSGPAHQQLWKIECKGMSSMRRANSQWLTSWTVNGVVKGEGTGADKAQARRIAAQQALQVSRHSINGDTNS